MILLLILALLLAGPWEDLSVAARVDAQQRIERARYAFVIGANLPFDEAYARSIFETRVTRQIDEEDILRRSFGRRVTPRIGSS